MPLLGDPNHGPIVKSLQNFVPKVLKLSNPSERPRAILVVTAHWASSSTVGPRISSSKHHDLYYDYYGFPPESYSLKYPAPGSPEIAAEVADVLRKEGGLEPILDERRGWDHGVFVPMILIHPKADIPIVQMSLLPTSAGPAKHFAMGRALSVLRDRNIAILGSGFATFHNLRVMFSSGMLQSSEFKKKNRHWSDSVTEAVLEEDVVVRGKKLENYRDWDKESLMHPRGGEEHFWPLVVCAGAAGNEKAKTWKDAFSGLEMVGYYWD